MKLLFKKTFTILFFATLLFACSSDDDNDDNQSMSVCDEGNPTGLITPETAQNMHDVYVENQYTFINEALSSDGIERFDNKEVLFDIDEIEKYICYVRDGAAELGLSNLGIRVYFGAKIDDEGIPRATIFFAPTSRGDGESEGDDTDIEGLNPLNLGDPGKGGYVAP